MADDDTLRASDEQRERAAQEIREHFAAGRLTDEELSDRVQAAYAARTEGDLKPCWPICPGCRPVPPQRKAELRRGAASSSGGCSRRPGRRRHDCDLHGDLGGIGASGFFWPIFVVLAVLVPLLRNGWRLYGPAPSSSGSSASSRRAGARTRSASR